MTLLLALVTTTTAWGGYKLSQPPMGCIDGCEGGRLRIHLWGWTCDPYYETKDLSFEQDYPASEWSKVSGRSNWYLAEGNHAEVYVLKNGKEVKAEIVYTNILRNDVIDYYNFYTEPRHYDMTKIPIDPLSLLYYLFDPLAFSGDEYYKRSDRQLGFDTWIEVDEIGTYQVVVYGTNRQGSESWDQKTLLGTRTVTVTSGYVLTFEANTTDNVSNMPQTQQITSKRLPYTWDVQRNGYTFVGWNTEPDGSGTAYRPGDEIPITADITLYAQWVRNSFYSYRFRDRMELVNYPSTISSVDDWNDLATMVNNGYIHGKTITLVNDIGDENNPITRCIGTQRYPFDNNFNGDGHSIYVNINDTIHEGTAPFRCMGICSDWRDDNSLSDSRDVWKGWADFGGWSISKLKVKGTVRGGRYCSGLVGISKGVSVFGSVVEADVITNSTHCAGVIGYVDGFGKNDKTNTMCSVFSGSISGATKQTGIFIGARKNGRASTCYDCVSTGTVSGANIDLAPSSQVSHCFKTTDLGKQGTYTPYDPAAIIQKMITVQVGNTIYRWSLDDDGSILPFHKEFYIDTATDWDNLATRIANGASFKNRDLVLRNNITVSTMLGTEEHPFDGTFDGQNHTLTFNLTTAESGCAPFRYIKDAKIKNLKIGGTLAHSVAAKTRLAGVAAYTSGNNALTDLTVSSTIRSLGASFHHAGLVAQINDGRVTFQNCTFKGKLLCDANSSGCGGLVAVNMGSGTRFYNCLFAPTECTVGTDKSCTISRDIKQPSVITGSYYTQELGEVQGSRVYTVATVPNNVFCSLWKGPDNVNYYQPVPTYIGGLQHTYNYNDGNPIDIDYTFYWYQYQLDAEKYTATIRKTTDGTEVTEVTDIGSYTLSITANEGSGCHGTVERPFYVTASSLPMNDEGHFLINSADDWNTLCELTSDAHQEEYQYFEGRVVELTADITITQQLGFFCGTLAGNGHMVTLNLGTAQSPFTRDGAALIYNLRGNAIVENLHVAGTIITSTTGRFAAGLVGLVGSVDSDQHNVRITGCRSSIRIKTTYNGQCHNGGFVGYAYNGKLAIENCLFDGCFTSEDANHVNATHWAGFVGYKGDAEVRLNSCLYYANRYEMSVPSADNATFYLPADATSVTVQNCCHTEQNWVNKQGTYVANNREASDMMTALGKEGWFIDFQYPQWHAYYPESAEWPLVFPRIGYHTAVPGNIADLEGNGTATDPYLIGSADDWSVFAASINNNVGTDAYYQLTEDIIINHGQKVGTVVKYFNVNDEIDEHRAFRGTFDGNGHTLTLDMTAAGECAPFAYAHDCTIKNLNIDGTISTSGQHASSLIVNASGAVTITGCRSSVTINSSYSGAGYNGGFVAQSSGTTNIEGCLFVGSILGEATYSCGGFVGSCPSGTVNISNSFFAPTAVTIALSNGSDNSATFSLGSGATVTNSYYTQPLRTGQGTALHTVTAAEGIDMSISNSGLLTEYSSGISVMGDIGFLVDDVFYAPEGVEVPIEKLELITGYSPQNATIVPSAGTYANGVLTMPAQNVVFQTSTPIALSTYTIHFDVNGGTGETMDDMHFTYGDDPVALTANTYTRTGYSFTGWNTEADGSGTAYTDGKMVENLTTASGTIITLYAQWEPWIAEGFGKTDSYTPDGTADNPYIISTAEEWNLLCDYISSGKGDLASSHYRLDNNLTVSRMMGTATNPFRGTFEGKSYTLTLNLTGVDEAATEIPESSEDTEDTEIPESSEELEDTEIPESSEDTESAEIPEDQEILEIPDIPNNPEDIPAEETLHALAPFAYVNAATIKNLRTTGTIYGETSYYAAGIVGKAEGNTTLQSCYSNVAITSTATVAEEEEESPMLGGIVAQSTGSLHFTDCLFDGTINAENTSHCGGFLGQRVSGSATFTNCLMDGELNCDTDGCGTYYQPSGSNSGYTITNSYYHTAYGAGQGTRTNDTGENLKDRLGENWIVKDGEKVVPCVNKYDLANGKLILSPVVYPYTGSPVDVSYTVRNFYNELLSDNTDYTVTIKNAEGTELTEVTELGEYAVTINGTGNYTGTKSVRFCVYESDGEDFPLQTDNDFQTGQTGYFFVKMPAPEYYSEELQIVDYEVSYEEDEDGNLIEVIGDPIWDNVIIPAEETPRIVNIPEGFTYSFKVYDDGGKNEDYHDCIDYYVSTLTLTCPEGYVFSVQGYMDTEEDCDYVCIYDGNSTSSEAIIDQASGRQDISIVTSGNSITFCLDADETESYEGLNVTVKVVAPPQELTLANDDSQMEESEKNTSVIAANDDGQINVALNGRTLYRDGTWNTLCLPFDIADIGSTPLKGATIKALESASYSAGALTLNFSNNLTAIEAGKPYIVKWTTTSDAIENPTFRGVTIKNELHPVESKGVTFGGSYSSLDNTDGLLLDAHNAGGNAFHATLSLPDIALYTDADRTTPATGTAIPFAANGNVTFYFSQSDYALTLHDDDSQAADGEKNADLIAAKNGEFAVVTLDGRTLYKDGTWNTLCLPFDLSEIKGTPLEGATVKAFALERAENNDGVLTLNFSDNLTAIEAGKPYIVKWPATGNDIVNPVFAGVTIKNQATATDNYFFEGSYNTLASTDGQILDAHNVDGKAFHAALSLSSLNDGCYDFNCYTDAEHTTPVGGTIPFNASDGSVTLYPKWALTLNNNDAQAEVGEKNADIISEAADTPTLCDVTLAGRTLYKDGEWNTLCLPFNLGNLQAGEGHYFDGTLLEGATVMTLKSTEFEDGTLTMNFINMPMVIAGVPYIVKWEGDGSNNLVAPVFEDVTISNSTINLETDYVDFIGTYSTTVIYEDGDEKHNLYLGSGNNLYYPSREGYSVKACRAYFQLKNGLTAGDPTAGVREFKLNFDGEITTGIIEVNTNNTNKTSDAFDLQGRKVENPKKGLYIVNGKKVVKH